MYLKIYFYSFRLINETVYRKKKSVNGQPIQVYIEYGIISDSSVFNDIKYLLNTTNNILVIQYMQILFSQMVNSVNQRFLISLENDPDLRISIVLSGMLIETVSINLNSKKAIK